MRQGRFFWKKRLECRGKHPASPLQRLVLLGIGILCFPYLVTLLWSGQSEAGLFRTLDLQEEKRTVPKTVVLDRGSSRTAMDLEEYVIGVTAVQVPFAYDYEQEALKAQVLIARTALVRQMDGVASVPEAALDFDYFDLDELNKKLGEENGAALYGRIREAAEETKGQVLLWQGDYIDPLFHQLSAGRTRQGGEEAPYLASVEAPEAETAAGFLSEFYFSRKELANRLNCMSEPPRVREETVLESIQIIEKDPAGYVETVLVGDKTYSGDAVRWALSLPSSAFHFEETEEGVCVQVKGIGHGYGLEQYGANQKAAAGWTAEKILHYYYKNIVIAAE